MEREGGSGRDRGGEIYTEEREEERYRKEERDKEEERQEGGEGIERERDSQKARMRY